MKIFEIETRGQGLYEFTGDVARWVQASDVGEGLLTLFVQQTSCSPLILENADPEVQVDLPNYFARLVPPTTDPSMSYLPHTHEGSDDRPAYIKAAMMPVSLSIYVMSGRLALRTWQEIYFSNVRTVRTAAVWWRICQHRSVPNRHIIWWLCFGPTQTLARCL